MHTRTLKLAALMAVAMVAAACGNGPELVDKTQPNYIKKADLLSGTWYLQDTVVDVPPTTSLTFVGAQNELEKVRFEVQEDYLVAYRTYEYFPGAEANIDRTQSTIGHVVTVDGKPYRGAPVAAWPIESHFDRIRDYNPATGEQSNVLVENTQDRPWYERDYIRVNWGKNVITNWNSATPQPVNYDGFNSGNDWMSSYIQPIDQETGDDAFLTDYDPNGQLSYFDFTVRQYWSPPTYDYPGYGKIPYCWLSPTEDCQSSVIKVRTSVRRVDEAHVADYEPLTYGDRLMKKFGLFRLGKPTYDRNQGATLSGRLLYAFRHDIWQRAHDANGAVIPVEQREVKPVVYYLSDSWPKDMMESARDMEASWDHAFRRAVAVPRGAQAADMPQMFYVCENPVPAGAPAACGPEGLHVRRGDIRYNMVNWVDQPQLAGPLGYGPSAADPETGEIVHAVANIYGAGIDQLAGTTMQMLDVLTGDLSVDQLLLGKDVKDFFANNRAPTDPRQTGPATSQSGLTNDATQKGAAFAAIKGDLLSKMQVMRTKGSPPLLEQDRHAVVAKLIDQSPALQAAMIDDPEIRAAVMSAAPGNEMRARLLNDPSFYRQVALQTMNHLNELENLWKAREDMASKKNIWLAEFSDGAYIWLAKDTKNYYESQLTHYQAEEHKSLADAQKLARTDAWTRIRNGLNRFITAHEVGHTLGLMHNFIATFDAMNYLDGYWDLRKSSIGVMAGGKRVMPLTPQDLMDASQPTEDQLEAGMPTLQYSSVMDYTARFPNHPHGVGKYDEAAILFSYSGTTEPGYVEVFKTTREDTDPNAWSVPNNKIDTTNMAKPLLVRGAHAEIPLAQVEHWTPASTFYSDRFHYTTLPFHFADKNLPFDQALDQGIQRMESRTFKKWSDMQKVYQLIELTRDDYYLNADSFSSTDSEHAQAIVGAVAKLLPEHKVPVEVPYMYCSDYEVGANLACNRYDSGADYYEMTRDWIERYNDYYIFSDFRRDRAFFNPINVLNSKYGRYTQYLPNVYQHWVYNIYWYRYGYSLNANEMEEYLGVGDPLTQGYWTMAAIDTVNHLLGELVTPSAGYFGKEAATGHWVHLTENNTNNTRFDSASENGLKQELTTGANAPYTEIQYVPRGPGKSMYTLYDTVGADSYQRVNEAGHFWDVYGALLALSSSETNFLGVDRGSDALRYSLPYYMTFPKELTKVFGSVWLNDTGEFPSTLVRNGDGTARVEKPVFVHGEDYVSDFVYPPRPATPVGGPTPAVEPIDASPSWSSRFYTELFGMAYFGTNFDLSYTYQNQVFRLGSGENISPASGYSVITFDDPFGGGYSYAALVKDGDTSNLSAAAAQVKKAQVLKSDWDYKLQQSQNMDLSEAERANYAKLAAEYEGKTREAVRNLEMMRALYDIFGRAW